jgi:hypothetical protein
MEQACQLASIRIYAGEVRTFVEIAEYARPSQILEVVMPAMFFGDDVLNVEIL